MIDTTPTIYPRPDDARVHEAMLAVFRVAECLRPDSDVMAEALARFVVGHHVTAAQAMWAIHELTVDGGFSVFAWTDFRPGRWRVTSKFPPAGLDVPAGMVHIEKSWSVLAFEPNHFRLEEIRKSIEPSSPREMKPKGRPRKDQGRATINARMIDEMQRTPESKDWSSREWMKRLGCSKSAVIKTKAWKMLIASHAEEKSTRKSRTPKKYEQ